MPGDLYDVRVSTIVENNLTIGSAASRPTFGATMAKRKVSGQAIQTWEDAILAFLDAGTEQVIAWAREHDPGGIHDPDRTETGFVRKHGQFFLPQELPRRKGFRRLTKKECYFNCMRMAIEHDLIYVEGFAAETTVGLPLSHAWCSDETGVVFDFTWSKLGKAYFGIPFDKTYVQLEWQRQLDEDDHVRLIHFEGVFNPQGPSSRWKYPGVLPPISELKNQHAQQIQAKVKVKKKNRE